MDSDSTYFGPNEVLSSITAPLSDGSSTIAITDMETVHISMSGSSMISKGILGDEAVAIKSLKDGYRGVPFYETALRKEAALMRELDHPNICKYLDFGYIEGRGNSLIMRWEDGATLRDKIYKGITPSLLRKITSQLCEVLQYVHSLGIAHRDLKPDNIIITRNGEDVRLIDFGFSDADWYARCKAPAGSLKYCPPEQINGSLPDVRSDIYSLGVIVGEMAQSVSRGQVRKWKKIVSKCVAPAPEDRFQNVSEILKAIASSERRRKLIPVVISACVLVLAVCAAVFISSDTYRLLRQRQQSRQCIEEVTRVILEAGASEHGGE